MEREIGRGGVGGIGVEGDLEGRDKDLPQRFLFFFSASLSQYHPIYLSLSYHLFGLWHSKWYIYISESMILHPRSKAKLRDVCHGKFTIFKRFQVRW